MPVTSRHPDYALMLPKWTKCRDLSEGADAVRAAGERYVPRLGGLAPKDGNIDTTNAAYDEEALPQIDTRQTDDQYAAMLQRAKYLGAFGQTVDLMTGLVFRKDPLIEAPDGMTEFFQNVNGRGDTLITFTMQILDEVLRQNRIVVLVEFPEFDEDNPTGNGIMPRWVLYKAEELINWYEQFINNVNTLQYAVIAEEEEEATVGDVFERRLVTQYRTFELMDGEYVQRVWRESLTGNVAPPLAIFDSTLEKTSNTARLVAEHVPLRRSQPLTQIPMFMFASVNRGFDVQKPVLYDLAELNLYHWRVQVDYDHGRHHAAMPTRTATGIQRHEVPRAVGPDFWIHSSDPATRYEILEFTGQGLQPSVDALLETKREMSQIGARELMPESAQAAEQTATASRLRNVAETSRLAKICHSVSAQMVELLHFTADWMGVETNDDEAEAA
ncbi:MAG: DUF4055 domain-containing protein [Gammaproteobacteria bacterium]